MSQIDQPLASIWLAPIFKKLGGGVVDCKMSQTIDYKSIKPGDIVELCGINKGNSGRTFISTGNWNTFGNSGGFCVLMSLSGSRLTVSGKMLHNMDIRLIGTLAA